MPHEKMLKAMHAKTEEIFNASETYQKGGKRGIMVAQIRDAQNPDIWHSSQQAYGKLSDGPGGGGFSFETTVFEKIAYTRRTGKPSGATKQDCVGTESYWYGAVISDDGNCICAFSGFEGEDDVLIAQAGLAEYNK